ncbi:MAG TPA: hypothetical protein VFD39_12860 [Trueperaceae bacterium]|nr:hypothetical protein [Trueperaceae bacterium]
MTRPDGPRRPRAAQRPDGPGRARVRLLIISNGHGEDAIAAKLASGLSRALPWLELEAFPLVGVGDAYQAAGVRVVGPRRSLPSAGLTLHHPRLLRDDLKAGLLPLTLAQLGFLWRARQTAVLVVGDAYAQLMAHLVPAPRRVLQPLVSVHQAFDLAGRPLAATALHRTFMERIRAPERWLMARADKVYTRDAETARYLIERGLTNAVSLGNPMVDDLESEPLVGAQARRLVIALLPGSRGYAERSLTLMAGAMRALAARLGGDPQGALGSAGAQENAQANAQASAQENAQANAQASAQTNAQSDAHANAHPIGRRTRELLGLVAWARPGIPPPPAGWRVGETPSIAGVRGTWQLPAEPAAARQAASELWFVSGRFAAVLASASVVIGTAGTANEQAAARGLPVVSFAVPPDYGQAFLANQERLLGGAARVVASDPEAVASAVLAAASSGSPHRRTAAVIGPERMGPPGATAALVADLARWLGERRHATG